MLKLPFSIIRAFEGLAVTREVLQMLRYARIALIVFIASAAVFLCCLLIITTYFLVHLIQGR